MRIYHPDWIDRTNATLKCLNIGAHCTLCAQSTLSGLDLCTSCQQLLKTLRHTGRDGVTTTLCLGCGLEQAHAVGRSVAGLASALRASAVSPVPLMPEDKAYCDACVVGKGQFLRRIIAPYRYVHPVDSIIKRVKYREDRQLTRVLGTLLADMVLSSKDSVLPQVLLPMPLHPNRLRHRGFNQAKDIAYWSGKRLGLRVAANQVSRIVDTGSLAGLNRQERQHRILGAFRAGDALVGRKVAIVDDVLTTGASARELAREIYDSGAESVELWVLARTSSNRVGPSEI